MKLRNIFLILALFLLSGNFALAQKLQVETFGNEKDKPVIFLHGGPGYNSVPFEATTAKELSGNGFFVISYDRRGEGRNSNLKAEYTFDQTFGDLNQIYQTYGLKKAILMGHSFGGVIATLFADKYPEKTEALILLSAPVSTQETLKHILLEAKEIYEKKGDTVNLKYISMLEKMDSTSMEYSSYCFMHAMANGFYSTKKPNERAVGLYKKFKTDSLLRKYATNMVYQASRGFLKNEHYTTISLRENLKSLRAKKVKVYAIYGKEDGLCSKRQIEILESILGGNRVEYLDNCSHNVFIDRQKKFIELVKKWTK
ncbi:MAG: alpha/beta hydrolase [Bacteroidales bacterium]|jgi:proline iminopeptidase|nr:alpha/beta hydrolase [Bacteroidales bacterium]